MQRQHSWTTRRRTERTRRESDPSPTRALSTQRQTRQRRRGRDDESQHAAVASSSASQSRSGGVLKTSKRRLVKSKPPKRMPGGRVIAAGEGTLTEVWRSWYVASGSAEIGTAVNDLHLVVPVKDELQEITDDESALEECVLSKETIPNGGGELRGELLTGLPEVGELGLYGMDSVATQWSDPMPWCNAPGWPPVKQSMIPFATPSLSTFDPQTMSTYDGGLLSDVLPPLFDKERPSLEPSFSSENLRMAGGPSLGREPREAASAPFSPRNANSDLSSNTQGDCSYFHLAEELMPERKLKGHASAPPFPSHYCQRCRTAENPPMMHPSFARGAPPPYGQFDVDPSLPFPAMGGMLPSFSSLPNHQRYPSEINPRSISSNLPPFYSNPHHPFLHPPSNLLI